MRCGFQSYIRKVGCVVFGCVAYYMNKPVEKRQSPWKRGRGDSSKVYTPQEWHQKMSWVEEKAIRSSLQEPDSDSESEKGDPEAAGSAKPPVIDVDSSDEQSLDEIPDALAWLNIPIKPEPPAEEAAEEAPAEEAGAEEPPTEEAPEEAPLKENEATNADTEDVAYEPQRKRIRAKRPPQPIPVPKARPMSADDVAPPEKSAAPSAPEAPGADTTAAEAPTEETEAPPEETGTADPSEAPSGSTGDQGWTAEEWELWTEAVRASNKKGSKGRKRKLQLYERFRSLKEQGLWKGSDPKPKYPRQG